MLAAIEKRGWLRRRVCGADRRTFDLELTALGRALLERVYTRWVGSGFVPVGVDATMSSFDVERDPYGERCRFEAYCGRLRYAFGETSSDIYEEDLDRIEGALTLPGHGSNGVPFVTQ